MLYGRSWPQDEKSANATPTSATTFDVNVTPAAQLSTFFNAGTHLSFANEKKRKRGQRIFDTGTGWPDGPYHLSTAGGICTKVFHSTIFKLEWEKNSSVLKKSDAGGLQAVTAEGGEATSDEGLARRQLEVVRILKASVQNSESSSPALADGHFAVVDAPHCATVDGETLDNHHDNPFHCHGFTTSRIKDTSAIAPPLP
jgi:hypothetical protein